MDQLENLWNEYNNPAYEKLRQIVRHKNLKYTTKQLKDFINSKSTLELHTVKPQKRQYEVPFVAPQSCFDWQVDLLDMQKFSKTNKGFKWIMVFIDIFDRKVYIKPLKNKTANETATGLKYVLEKHKCIPKRLTSDDGSEWKANFQKTLDEFDIYHRITNVGDHRLLGVIDRFSKTIKNIIYRYFTENDTTNWIDKLDNIVKAYNDTPHQGLCGMTPLEAEDYWMSTRECHTKKLKKVKKYDFKIGDNVRKRLKKTVFERGYARHWTKETFSITDIIGQNYILDDGSEFRGQELIHAHTENKEVRKDAVDIANKTAKFKRRQQKENIGPVNEDGDIEVNKRLEPAKENRTVPPEEKIIGKRLSIYWPNYRKWYDGVVQSYDTERKEHVIYYDKADQDGNHEIWEKLYGYNKTKWKYI